MQPQADPLPPTRGSALQLAFAQRYGMVDPDVAYIPKPPVFYDDNRRERRARRTRTQRLRSWGRLLVITWFPADKRWEMV